MNQKDFKTKIDTCFRKENYRKALDTTIKYFDMADIDEIENVVKYFELLHNVSNKSARKSKYIEPLSKYLIKRLPSLSNYIKASKEINKLEKLALIDFEREIKEYYQYSYPIARLTILAKFEVYYHKLLKKLKNTYTEDFLRNECVKESSTSIIQMSLESLGKFLTLLEEREALFKRGKVQNRESFIKTFKRIDKKTSNPQKLVNKINALSYVEMLKRSNIKNDLSVYTDNDTTRFVYNDFSEYKKNRIAQLRLENFEQNQHIVHNFSGEDTDIVADFSKIIHIDKNSKSFKLEFNIISDEFIAALKESYENFSYYSKQMYYNNYLEEENMLRKIVIDNIQLQISFEDAINFYFAIETFSRYYFKGVEYYNQVANEYPLTSMSVIDHDNLFEVIKQFFSLIIKKNITRTEYNQLVKLFTFGENGIYDLYYKPLIVGGDSVIILPSIFRQNMFHRTFLNHMNKIDSSYKNGKKFETYIKKHIKKLGFKVYERKHPGLNFKGGDIDILMQEGNFVFYGQIKNRMNPLDLDDFDSFNRKINKVAVRQLEHAEEFLKSNPRYINDELEIKDLNEYKLIPFIMTNSFYGSGEVRKNIPIVDISSFNKFISKEDIILHEGEKKTTIKKIFDSSKSIGENFYEYLYNPYFLDDKLYHNLYYGCMHYIGNSNRIVTLSCERELQTKKIEDSYIWRYINKEVNN